MDRAKVELALFPIWAAPLFKTTDGVRAARVDHAVEDGHARGRFCLLARKASNSNQNSAHVFNRNFILGVWWRRACSALKGRPFSNLCKASRFRPYPGNNAHLGESETAVH